MVEFKYPGYRYITPTLSHHDMQTVGEIILNNNGEQLVYKVRRAVYRYWDQSNNFVYEIESTIIPIGKCI